MKNVSNSSPYITNYNSFYYIIRVIDRNYNANSSLKWNKKKLKKWIIRKEVSYHKISGLAGKIRALMYKQSHRHGNNNNRSEDCKVLIY